MSSTATPILEQAGRVIALRGDAVEVCARSRSTCARCAAGTGCGGGILGALLDRGDGTVLATPRGGTVHVGDRVTLRLPARALVEAAAVAYLAPLAGLLSVLLLLAWRLPELHPLWSAFWGLAGLAAGMALARRIAHRRRGSAWRPDAWPAARSGA